METKSWRLVTMLPAISKILEKVFNSQLKVQLKRNGLLSPKQYAYLEEHSD